MNLVHLIQIYTYTLIMLGHFKKSASVLTDQETQMVGNDQSPATICNTVNELKLALLFLLLLFILEIVGKSKMISGEQKLVNSLKFGKY